MSSLSNELSHLKHHVKYPANKEQVNQTCSNMSDVPETDRSWFMNSLPEGNYRNPEEVMNALLRQV